MLLLLIVSWLLIVLLLIPCVLLLLRRWLLKPAHSRYEVILLDFPAHLIVHDTLVNLVENVTKTGVELRSLMQHVLQFIVNVERLVDVCEELLFTRVVVQFR